MKFEERKSIWDERDSLRKFSNEKLESSPVSEDKHHLFDQDEEISDGWHNGFFINLIISFISLGLITL